MTSPNTIIADMQTEIDSLKSAIEDSQDIASKAIALAMPQNKAFRVSSLKEIK